MVPAPEAGPSPQSGEAEGPHAHLDEGSPSSPFALGVLAPPMGWAPREPGPTGDKPHSWRKPQAVGEQGACLGRRTGDLRSGAPEARQSCDKLPQLGRAGVGRSPGWAAHGWGAWGNGLVCDTRTRQEAPAQVYTGQHKGPRLRLGDLRTPHSGQTAPKHGPRHPALSRVTRKSARCPWGWGHAQGH